MPLRSRSTILGGLVLALALASAAWCLHAYRDFVHDDAYITLRYVRNFLAGDGLVWNPGERVEGYTSFGAVLAIALPGLLRVDLLLAARLVNGLAVIATALFAAWYWARRDGSSTLSAAIGAALVLVCPPLLTWVMGGLEAPFFAAWVVVACGLAARMFEGDGPGPKDWHIALLLGALALVRPDGAVFGGVAGLFYALWAWRRADRPGPSILRFAAAGFALPFLHLVLRLVYYGSALPTSVAAKTIGQPPTDHLSRGFSYLLDFLAGTWVIAGAALVVAIVLLIRRTARLPVLFLWSCVLAYAALVVKAGGDHMPAHRLLVPVYPLLVLVLAHVLGPRSAAPRPVWSIVPFVVLVAQALVFGAPRYQPTDPAAFVGRIVGEHLDARLPAGSLVALNTAGSTAYFAPDLRFIDMLGLNDAHIAWREIDRVTVPWQQMPGHAKGDGAYVLSRRPDWIILGPAEGSTADRPWFLSDLEIVRDPRFGSGYGQRVVEIDARTHTGYGTQRATRTGTLRLVIHERRD